MEKSRQYRQGNLQQVSTFTYTKKNVGDRASHLYNPYLVCIFFGMLVLLISTLLVSVSVMTGAKPKKGHFKCKDTWNLKQHCQFSSSSKLLIISCSIAWWNLMKGQPLSVPNLVKPTTFDHMTDGL